MKVKSLTDTRHVVTRDGRRVAGIRCRAWQPPTCLQPTIPVHALLVIDLPDTWNGRRIGGCTDHVSHPGGRSYTTFPGNAYGAESRRLHRFFPCGHTPEKLSEPAPEPNLEFPFTLDLRT